MASTVMELVKEIDETRSQCSASSKDEIRIMRAMLNDPEFVVDVYAKNGVVGQYCPYEDAHDMVANIIKNATKISTKEAEALSENYEFSKSDASTFVNFFV